MREVVTGAAAGGQDARLALDVYIHRLRAGIAAMAAAMGGLDLLVFTGGVGENSTVVRSEAAAGLGFLGVRLDAGRNAAGAADGGGPADREIGQAGAPVRSFVVAAREDIQIAAQVRAVLAAGVQ
jgi:acetate kinase